MLVITANMVMETIEERALSTFSHSPRFWTRYERDNLDVIIRA